MIIDSAAVEMGSERRYTSKHTASHRYALGTLAELSANSTTGSTVCDENAQLSNNSGKKNERPSFLEMLGQRYENALDEQDPLKRRLSSASRAREMNKAGAVGDDNSLLNLNMRMQFHTLNYLFRIFFGGRNGNISDRFSGMISQNATYQQYTFTESYEETETTSFETKGTVKTKDGRELNFDINVTMSRSFYEETSLSMMRVKNPMIDPLVIDLDGNPDMISDQTFYFDLDADGELDEINSLRPGSGFLALDKNNDGIINDGSELFGALSGNGFEELAEYDLDGNGWIDEADEIYDRLKVWSVDKDGNYKLFSLRESDVGAICLASAPTQFSHKDENNDTRAMVRQSGFFLRESSGMAGMLQQLDFAKRAV